MAALLLGGGGALLASLLSHDKLLEIAVGLLIGIATLQIGELWQLHSRTPRLAKLELVLSDEVLYRHVETLLEANQAIEELSRKQGAMADFFRKERTRCLGKTLFTLEELRHGRMTINDPDTQYEFAVGLAAAARRKIQTVSYRDEEFWTLSVGERYLEHNRHLIDNKGIVERVFIYEDEDSVFKHREVVRKHLAYGVSAYILPVDRIAEPDKRDYVIYDDTFLRYAETVEADGSRKTATLEMNDLKAGEYQDRFRNLVNRSQPAEAYLVSVELRVAARARELEGLQTPPPNGEEEYSDACH